ncbi:hypothetical protein OG889_03160 [Streptomyces sp. NBC_00481]|uniref:hypothetical protein n=1 Tax=unclassified Streptomyces TaxID=2593676 RepID=UPI002DDBBD2B|nr:MULTISPECIES: hypothetical protein [unclassified Streptomyces]WRY93808.1 hypothetical protein OG889_03160 [Streptomyces sp. NBC_00481]
MRSVRALLARLAVALLAGAGLVLAGPGSAQADTTVEIPAPSQGGISATVVFHRTVVPQPYNPDPTASYGDRQCLLRYHEYYATPGCGGFALGVTLHDVRDQPGYLAGLSSAGGYFGAHADTARTFGCLLPDGTFDHSTSFVVRTEQQPLSPVYYQPDSNWLLTQFRSYPDQDFGPPFFVNFPPVEVNCPEGTTATQYGLKVTDVKISIDDPNVFGRTTWTAPGPFYA